MTAEEELKNLYQRMYQAMIQKDLKTLNEILDDDFVLIHMTGMHQTKKQFMEAVKDGTLNYFSEETDAVDITVKENHAEVAGKSRVEAAVFGGGQYIWNLQQDLSAVKKNDRWMFARSSASVY